MIKPPKYAIVNYTDRPEVKLIAEYVDGIGYCYMDRENHPHLKEHDGMNPENPTAIEDFGFEIVEGHASIMGVRTKDSVAQYKDGRIRPWQDTLNSFCHMKVADIKRRRSHAERD